MQEVRVDGFDRLDPLETAHAEPTLGPLPLPQPEFPNYPLAIVEWHDAWFDLDLESPEVCRQDYLVRTVGFLVGEGPRFVSLAQEILLERSAERFDRPAPTHLASG